MSNQREETFDAMMERPMYYDMEGKPIVGDPNDPKDYRGTLTWARLFENTEARRIGNDKVNGFWVTTVWLGMDHSFGSGPPLIFETMIFPEGTLAEVYCDRYATKDEAIAGHAKAVELARAGKFSDE